jgi:hypothetical protein
MNVQHMSNFLLSYVVAAYDETDNVGVLSANLLRDTYLSVVDL